MLTSESCVIIFALLNGTLCLETKIIYTTPKSHLQLTTREFEPSIYCGHSTEGRWGDILNTSGEYDTMKDKIIKVKSHSLTLRAPRVHGTYNHTFSCPIEREYLDIVGLMRKSDDASLTFKYNIAQAGYFGLIQYGGYVKYFLEFKLKIHSKNVSIYDLGRYDCRLLFPIHLQLVTAKIKFLHQTDDNIIYGQEGQSTDISCITVQGYDAKELSIQKDGKFLATSNSSIVTFSFTPNRHDNLTQYRCMIPDPEYAEVYVKLVIHFAPDIKVVVRESSIDCIPKGYPETYTFNKWEHQSEQGNHIRFLDGLQNGTLDLQTLPQQYHMNGRYVCRVSNGISGSNRNLFQKGFGSYCYSGAPIFVPENRKVKSVVPGERFTMSFLIYSNPIVENIWIGMTGTNLTNAYRMHFGISKAALMYTASRENGNIIGYEIVIETDLFRSIDIHEYTIWAENKLGVDSYQFQILEDDQCYSEYSNQLIASGVIATVLLIYLFVSHVWFCVRVRKKRTRLPYIQEPLNNHEYDEIGPISNQEVNGHPLTTGHQELNQPVIILQYPQDESATTNRDSQDPMNDNTDISSTVSEQDRTSNELQQVIPSERKMHDIRSNALHDVTTYNEQMSGDKPATSTNQDGVSKTSSTGNDQDSNRTSTHSTNSDESSGSILGCVGISDGYENPYQSMMPANQELYQYCDLTNISE